MSDFEAHHGGNGLDPIGCRSSAKVLEEEVFAFSGRRLGLGERSEDQL